MNKDLKKVFCISSSPQSADARRFISFEIMLFGRSIVSGVLWYIACAIFLLSFIFAMTGMSEYASSWLRVYSWAGDLILFTINPSIGVFCSFASSAAFSDVSNVTWSGDVTTKTLSAVSITGFNSS